MSNIQDLRSRIRHFIQHPRRLRPYLAEKPVWNMLASSFDVIADTEMAVCTYEAMSEPEDPGYRYLTLYGVLQALYVQQDAVESMVWAFEPNAMPKYKIEFEPEANEIRRIRNQAIGHPTKEGNVNSLKKPGVQMSHHIVQHSMHKSGFTILTGFANGGHVFTDVNLAKLIEKNRVMVCRILDRIKSKLEAAEMEHRSKFKDERLADLFPETLDYYFEKIFSGADSPKSPDGEWARMHVKMISDILREFRAKLEERGILDQHSTMEYYLKEVEYPTSELLDYFAGSGSLKDHRAANIFTHFLQDKMRSLEKIAAGIDEEYASEESA